MNQPNSVSHFFISINIDSFIDKTLFYQSINRYMNDIKDTPLVEGASEIFLPGEIEHINKEKNAKEEVPLPESVYSELINLSKECELNQDLLNELKILK